MINRIIIGLIGIPLLLFIILSDFYNNLLFLVFVIIFNCLALNEIYYFFLNKNIKLNKLYFVISGILMILALYIDMYYSDLGVEIFHLAFLSFIIIYVTSMIFKQDYKDVIIKISFYTFGLFYISYLSSYFLLLKNLPNGQYYFLLIIVLIWFNDSAAYFIGTKFGKKKLPVKASPNKSYAGLYGGIIFSIIAVFLMSLILKDHIVLSITHKIIIGVLFGLMVVLSDLIESILKRSVAVKDSKGLFPGHGGVLDIFDGWLITIPLFYYYLKIAGIC